MHLDHVSRLLTWVSPSSGPICPVMDFCRLSAGSFRFLIHPDPTEAFCLPHGSLTSSIDRLLDLVGVTPFRMCEMQLRRMPSYCGDWVPIPMVLQSMGACIPFIIV